MTTSVKVSDSQHVRLKSLKNAWGVDTLADVIERLLAFADAPAHPPAQPQSKAAGGKPQPAAEEDAKKSKPPAGLSYELLADDPDCLSYFTGLNTGACAWLFPKLEKAVRRIVVFACFADHSAVWSIRVVFGCLFTLYHS